MAPIGSTLAPTAVAVAAMTRAARTPPLSFDTLEDVVAAVRDGGGRLSTPRRMILEALFAADGPVSAEAIAEGAGHLELTSVYRNLERLEELGVVRHVHLGHGPGRYALVGRGAREYLVCDVCDRVTAVEPARLDSVRAAIRADFGFRADFGHFPILGVCATCAEAREHQHRHGDVVHSHPHAHETSHTHSH